MQKRYVFAACAQKISRCNQSISQAAPLSPPGRAGTLYRITSLDTLLEMPARWPLVPAAVILAQVTFLLAHAATISDETFAACLELTHPPHCHTFVYFRPHQQYALHFQRLLWQREMPPESKRNGAKPLP
mmetsp:Transcript_15412/g.26307  ORF Transcript_15412/g.26307 Transcript_15412/m.26307 type:complete len:130 (+) Transcript_15412:507-896(+)